MKKLLMILGIIGSVYMLIIGLLVFAVGLSESETVLTFFGFVIFAISLALLIFIGVKNSKTNEFKENRRKSNKLNQIVDTLTPMNNINIPQGEDVAFYRNGVLFQVLPKDDRSLYDNRDRAKSANYIVSDGVLYNMNDSESITSFPIPKFAEINGMPQTALDLAYNFQVRLKKEERPDIAVAMAYKTADLMLASSSISWGKKDYYRVVIQLWSIGKIDEADTLLEYLKQQNPIVAADDEYTEGRKQAFEYNLSMAKYLNEDYIHTGVSNCCEKCTPYRNRVYSISGKDKRFPKFSDYIQKPEEFCCLSYSGFLYYPGCTLTEYKYDKLGNVSEFEVDAIKHSNRPFVDDRSEYQKAMCNEWTERNEKRRKHDETYYSREHWIEKYYKKQSKS